MVVQYGHFEKIGFNAGMVRKGPWNTKEDIYRKIETEIAVDGKQIIIPKQCHGSDVLLLEQDNQLASRSVDGIISTNNGYCLTISTADCLPLLLADPESGFFGAIHIGWRGLLGGIVENMFHAIKNLDIGLDRLYISLGPAIGDCCFEIGPEVALLFDGKYLRPDSGKSYLDIRGAVLDKLLAFGVLENRIQNAMECTSCDSEKYYSYRRDGNSPIQMVSYICKK